MKLSPPKPVPAATSYIKSLGGPAQKGKVFSKVLNKVYKLVGSKTLSDADLMVELERKAAGKGLDWKVSVVDFLKLLGIDSSRENRDALAAELGVPPELESGSAAKNEALRLAVFKKLAENGGNIPGSLLD